MKHLILVTILFLVSFYGVAQSEQKTDVQQIEETLMHYIEGTANGEPDRVTKAFHPDLNLYSVTEEDTLKVWFGQNYISGIKKGVKNNRKGRIISIDFDNNVAMAKAEIDIPNWRIFTDYFLLVKYEGQWKILHKSYTWKEHKKE